MSNRLFLYPSLASLLCIAAGLALGLALPPGPLPHGMAYLTAPVHFDGVWYMDIARNGYRWNPAGAAIFGNFQNAAFFPLFPLFEAGLIRLLGPSGQYPLVALALAFGVWSNLAFARFAHRLLPGRAALWASAFFACWPAACFLWLGYPTGLINLCAIQALGNYTAGRRLRAALWCGLGTAAAPAMVFTAAGLCLHAGFRWLKNGAASRRIPELAAFGLLSTGGLLAFMAYLLVRFHDPLVFVKAQDAWGVSPSLATHLERFISPLWYCAAPADALQIMSEALRGHALASVTGRNVADIIFQYNVDFWAVFFGLFILAAMFRSGIDKAIPLAGLFTVLGYLWYFAPLHYFLMNGIRIIYPAIALPLGAGLWAAGHQRLACPLLGLLMILIITETALLTGGYLVL